MQNIEIKYKISNAGALRKRLLENPVVTFQFRHHQKDIYFKAPEGRLKIRIEDESTPRLIEYFRPDENKPRISNYTLTPLENVEKTQKELSGKYGILTTVEKWRELYFYKNVRIHLDEVVRLGWFLEFESVISETCDESAAKKNLAEIMEFLSGFLTETQSTGYMNLLLGK
mgnify:CR=1 FL=1